MGLTGGVVDDREGFAPVTLTGEQPVAKLVLDSPGAHPVGLETFDDRRLRVLDIVTVEEPGVHQGSVAHVRLGGDVGVGADHLADRQSEHRRELMVAGVVGRDRHDRAGAVAHEDVVGDEDRNLLSVHGIDGEAAGEDTRLLLVLLALEVGLRGDRRAVLRDRGRGVGPAAGPAIIGALGPCSGDEVADERMLGRENHVGGAEQGVGTGGEHLDAADAGHVEANLGTARASDPVALHGLDLVRPVQQIQVVEQPVGVRGDPHHPLPQMLPEHREVAAVTAAVGGDLLVGQHGAQSWAPVHQRITQVHQAMVVEDLGALGRGEVGPAAPLMLPT